MEQNSLEPNEPWPMTGCRDCELIRYSSSSSPFANLTSPFIYVLFSECVAGKAYALDPNLYVFKLGFSNGGQDRFRSIIDGWRYKGGKTPPLGNCRRWIALGVWKMRSAEVFERKFIKVARELQRIVPPHVYSDLRTADPVERTNGESEIYWLSAHDFERVAMFQDRVCTEERGNFAALQQIFDTIKARGDRFRTEMGTTNP